jgi:hypothetical protein
VTPSRAEPPQQEEPMAAITLRFVEQAASDLSQIFIARDTDCPYVHVEAVTPEGKYLGALPDGGVQARDPGYDTTWTRELIVAIPCTQAQQDAFYAYLESKIGSPYDDAAIAHIGAALIAGPNAMPATESTFICSAAVHKGLLASGKVLDCAGDPRTVTPFDELVVAACFVKLPAPRLRAATG